ncbi:MAG: cysteine desulfurase family protein [Pirellulales bacterium]
MQTLYLDYNATTPVAPQVRAAMLPHLEEAFGNPSSQHLLGRAAAESVADARRQVAELLGAVEREIVFTSGGTESNNLAIVGVMQAAAGQGKRHLVISCFEHPATVAPADHLQRLGSAVTRVAVTPQGVIDPRAIEAALRPDTALVSIMHANNEIGTIQPIDEMAALCRARGILLHTDAAQSVGKIATNVEALGVDLLSVAGHKLYAPKGIGALYVRSGTTLESVLRGAGQERGLRPGTENVASIVGLGRAASLVQEDLDSMQKHLAALRDRLHQRLLAAMGERLTVNGQQAERLPNTLSVNLPDVEGDRLLRSLPQLCASTGAACHSGDVAISATLSAIGLPADVARGTLRLSVGRFTRPEDCDGAADLLIDAWEKQRTELR